MFHTLKQKIALGIFIFLVLSIPVGSYLVSQYQTIKSSASEPKKTTVRPLNKESPPPTKSTTPKKLDTLQKTLKSLEEEATKSSSSSSGSLTSTTVATSFGATLSLKAKLQGRPEGKQSAKMFIGILEGSVVSNPKFTLNFSVDLPDSGSYENISLAGLTPGSQYTAILKGPAQIATSSAFIMSPDVTKLNNNEALTLLTGDLNDDNVINASDYSIEQNAMGQTSASANWNERLDFNKDGVINLFDISIIVNNFGKIGASGTWFSPIPTSKTATGSASLAPVENKPQGTVEGNLPDGRSGYWIFVPK